jgi:hypothetical protein
MVKNWYKSKVSFKQYLPINSYVFHKQVCLHCSINFTYCFNIQCVTFIQILHQEVISFPAQLQPVL